MLSARQVALYNKALAYHEAHPTKRIWYHQRFTLETGITIIELFPVTGAIDLWYVFHPDDFKLVPNPDHFVLTTKAADYFSNWWNNYEIMLLGVYRYFGPVAYCNIIPPVGP